MNFEKKKTKPSISTYIIIATVIALFSILFVALGLAYAKSRLFNKYLIEASTVLSGNRTIYATCENETVLLNDVNSMNLGKIMISGSVWFAGKKDTKDGRQILISSVNENGETETILIEALENGKTDVTVTTADNTVYVTLRDIRFVNFKRLCVSDSPNGPNVIVNSLP